MPPSTNYSTIFYILLRYLYIKSNYQIISPQFFSLTLAKARVALGNTDRSLRERKQEKKKKSQGSGFGIYVGNKY